MFQRSKTFWRLLLGRPEESSAVALQDGPDERRVWVRFPADLETAFKPAGTADHSRVAARIRNISLGGVNLRAERSFCPGDMLSIELPCASGEARCNVLACVVHCDAEPDGHWSLGCTFSRELSEADLQSLGANQELFDLPDQRQWKRFPTNVHATYQPVATAEQTPRPAKVLNISVSGIGLSVDREIENGALLSVDLRNASATVERSILACVVHINRQSATQWALGCNFIRSLSEDDLKSLL
jgi:c-di-GMP-binding flagellar brake protein YcgR